MSRSETTKEKTGRHYAFLFTSLSVYLTAASFFPDRIAYSVREDGPVENMTAIFAFLGAYLCVQIFMLRKKYLHQNAILLFPVFFLFFFMGGEEISWGQRILNIKPVLFSGDINYQREFTLHNFYRFHKLIYMGGFGLVVLMAGVLPLLGYFWRGLREFYRKLCLPLMPVSVMIGMWLGLIFMVALRHTRFLPGEPVGFEWDVSYQLQEWREFYFCLVLFAYVFGDYFYLLRYRTAYDYRTTAR